MRSTKVVNEIFRSQPTDTRWIDRYRDVNDEGLNVDQLLTIIG